MCMEYEGGSDDEEDHIFKRRQPRQYFSKENFERNKLNTLIGDTETNDRGPLIEEAVT